MEKTELTYTDSGIASTRQQDNNHPLEGAAETNQGEWRCSGLGVLIVLAVALGFYGGIAVCIWKLLLPASCDAG